MYRTFVIAILILALTGIAYAGTSSGPPPSPVGPQATCNAAGQIEGGVYDVMCPKFGAKNDFVDDDATAMQNAIYAACHATPPATPDSSVPKGPLYFPSNLAQGANGLYLHNTPLRLTCGNMEIYGRSNGLGGVHNTSALFQNYYGPAVIAEAYGANTLQYVSAINGTTGAAITTTGCSGATCGTVTPTDLVGFFGPNKLNGLSALSVELFFKPGSFSANQVNQILGATAGSIAANANVSFNIFGAFNTSTLTATMDIGGSVKTLTGPSMSSGTLYAIALDYDGTTLRMCVNGSLSASTAASGTITQNVFEMMTLPNASQANWPDAYGAVGTTYPGTLGQIRISNTARHAGSCTMSTSVDLGSDNNTLEYIKWDNTNGSDIKPWQTAYLGSGPTTAFLPIHGTASAYEVTATYMHDMELGGPLFAIWAPDSKWYGLSASSNTQIPAFDFNEDDWLNTTDHLYAHNALATGFEFGSRYNEGHNSNNHAETNVHGVGYLSISNGGTQDDYPVVQSASDLYWPFMFINTQALLNFPFADLETSDANYQGWLYAQGNFGNITVNNAQITTFANAPFVSINCSSGAPVILNGADFGAVVNTSEYFHYIGTPNCTHKPQLINPTSMSTGGTALDDAPGQSLQLIDGVYSTSPKPSGAQYYIAPASASPAGSDSNTGTDAAHPWLTPNHALNCGDVINAPAGTYNEANFRVGQWGAVTCPGNNNVAWLKCSTFDTCKINITGSGSHDAMTPSQSYWGVQGWEVTANSAPSTNQCFEAYPGGASTVHHIIFANDIANGCGDGGITAGNNGSSTTVGVDYVAIVGNIVYNAAQDNANCYSGIDVVDPINSDTVAGTHYYIAGNYSWGNVAPNPCAGSLTTDGNGILLDTLDHGPYTGQIVVENNIAVYNGGFGFETFENTTGGASHSTVYQRHNTAYGNQAGIGTNTYPCSEFGEHNTFSTSSTNNLAETRVATACSVRTGGAVAMYAAGVDYVDSTDTVATNWLFSASGNNTLTGGNSVGGGGFTFGSNTTGTSAAFANPVNPGAPSCGGFANVPACAATIIANYTPATSGAKLYGYQAISGTSVHDPLFPAWLCSVTNMPAGLITMGCS